MKKHVTISNVLFIVLLFLILYKPSRIWVIRQVSFSPTIENIQEEQRIQNYSWQLKGLNTENINFSELKGKVVFLNFWATWCPPCVAELPYIQSFYNEYKNKVAFVFITTENWKEVAVFFRKNDYEFPIYQSNNSLLEGLPLVNSIPRTFLIDKKGNIRIDKSGSADWNTSSFRSSIDKLLIE